MYPPPSLIINGSCDFCVSYSRPSPPVFSPFRFSFFFSSDLFKGHPRRAQGSVSRLRCGSEARRGTERVSCELSLAATVLLLFSSAVSAIVPCDSFRQHVGKLFLVSFFVFWEIVVFSCHGLLGDGSHILERTALCSDQSNF